MGIDIGQWRARIGGFSQPSCKLKFKPAAIVIGEGASMCLGVVLTCACAVDCVR